MQTNRKAKCKINKRINNKQVNEVNIQKLKYCNCLLTLVVNVPESTSHIA